jgi:TPR repeat protein
MIRKRVFGSAAGIVVVLSTLISSVMAQEVVEEDPLEAGLAAVDAGDLIGAVEFLRIAADEGSAEAQAWLGYIFDYSEDDEEAVAYYRAAAEQGNVRGIVGLAEMYSKGEGVEKDADEGRKYYIKAAEMGDAGAMRALIAAYEQGGLGVEPDVGEAEYWKSRLAEVEANEE